MTTQHANSKLLRVALYGNSVFSALSGIFLIVAAKLLAVLIGVSPPSILIGIGVAVFVNAIGLFLNARRQTINLKEAWLAVILDTAWVVGSVILIFAGYLSTLGNWVVAIVAKIVLLFGVLQLTGIYKLRQNKMSSKALTVLALSFVTLMGWSIVSQGSDMPTADIRTPKIKREGYTAALTEKGKELLQRVAERHGLRAWQNYQTAEMIAVDEWAPEANGWWSVKQQRLKTQALLRSFTSRVELLNGVASGEILGIQSWQGYT